MGIGKADDLSGVTWIGEDFLVASEAGIENDFAAPAGDGASGAAVKDAPVLQRENCRSVQNFRQSVLRPTSFFVRLSRRQRTEVIDRPVGKDSAAVNELAVDRPEDARIV